MTAPSVWYDEYVDLQSPIVQRRLAQCTFPVPGTPVTCAVSGGPDSTAMLILAVAANLDVTAVHVDHGLRPESHLEAEVVAETARMLGVKFESHTVQVNPSSGNGGVEARARAARHELLPNALFGHTAEDQTETVLLSLIRGAGLDGLSGMTTTQHPILNLRRADTVEIAEWSGCPLVQDPTNNQPIYTRNRVRHELIPLANSIADRDIVPIVARQSELLADDAAFLNKLASQIDPQDAKAVAAAPLPLARRALRSWLQSEAADGYPPDAAAIERVLAVARNECLATQIYGGLEVRRSKNRLYVKAV